MSRGGLQGRSDQRFFFSVWLCAPMCVCVCVCVCVWCVHVLGVLFERRLDALARDLDRLMLDVRLQDLGQVRLAHLHTVGQGSRIYLILSKTSASSCL